MKKNIFIFCLFALCLMTACSAKDTVYKAPDETQVIQQKPLTLPPDYELRPPLDNKGNAEKK